MLFDSSSSTSRIRGFLWCPRLTSRSTKFSAFYLAGIMMECVNWCLGSRDLQNAIPNMEIGCDAW